MLRCTKSSRSRDGAQRNECSNVRGHPSRSRLPGRRAARAWAGDRNRARRALAAHAAALRARSHQSLAAPRIRRRVHARRLRLRRHRDAHALGASRRDDPPRHADPQHRRDALPSRSRGQRGVALAAARGAGRDDPCRVPDRARGRRGIRRPHERSYHRPFPPARNGRRASVRTRAARQRVPPRRAGIAAVVLPLGRRRHLGGRGHDLAHHRRPGPFAGTCGAPLRRTRRADLGRHAAADDFHQCQREPGGTRRRSAPALPRLDCAVHAICPRTPWCCPRTACRSAVSRCASASSTRITTQGWRSSTPPYTRPPGR